MLHLFAYFYIDTNDKILLPSESTLSEIGIKYKKSSDSNWTYFRIANNTVFNRVRTGTGLLNTGIGIISGDGNLFNPPRAYYKYNYMSPIIVAIRNLEQNTSYDMESYYKLSDVEYTFNPCTSTTFEHQNVMYNCTEVTGDTDEHNEYLRNNINKACERAKTLEKYHVTNNRNIESVEANPHSDVYKIVEELVKIN